MAAIFSFTCATCNEIHEGSPSVAFRAPDPFLEQTQEVQDSGKLSSDFCTYTDTDGPHYFIRVCLEIPIDGISDPFLWGVWVSLSKKSYDDYVLHFDSPTVSANYFAYLCNYLPGYENTHAIKAQVLVRTGGNRPLISLEETEHLLSLDFLHGITIQRAQEIAELIQHP